MLYVFYHWSPHHLYEKIARDGLKVYSRSPADHSFDPGTGETISIKRGNICLGNTPRQAWTISANMDWGKEIGDWDLWQVEISSEDDLEARAERGEPLYELRVNNSIPSSRVWYCGTRSTPQPEAISEVSSG